MADGPVANGRLAAIITDQGSVPHDSSTTHVTGKSEYIDDRPMLKGELHCGLVYSPYARARVRHLDTAPALAIPGVVCAVTAADVAHNVWGTIFQDQPIIAACRDQGSAREGLSCGCGGMGEIAGHSQRGRSGGGEEFHRSGAHDRNW